MLLFLRLLIFFKNSIFIIMTVFMFMRRCIDLSVGWVSQDSVNYQKTQTNLKKRGI